MARVELKNGAWADEELMNAVWKWILQTEELTYLFACAYARQSKLFQSENLRNFLYERGILDADWQFDEDISNILLSTIAGDKPDEDSFNDGNRFVHPWKDSSEMHRWICDVVDARVRHIPTEIEGLQLIEIDPPPKGDS